MTLAQIINDPKKSVQSYTKGIELYIAELEKNKKLPGFFQVILKKLKDIQQFANCQGDVAGHDQGHHGEVAQAVHDEHAGEFPQNRVGQVVGAGVRADSVGIQPRLFSVDG